MIALAQFGPRGDECFRAVIMLAEFRKVLRRDTSPQRSAQWKTLTDNLRVTHFTIGFNELDLPVSVLPHWLCVFGAVERWGELTFFEILCAAQSAVA